MNEIETRAVEIRHAVCAISLKSPTGARAVIDKFLQHIAGTLWRLEDQNFPVPVRRHYRDPERTVVDAGKYNLLMFHIGNAILAYHDAYRDERIAGAKPNLSVLRDRVELLKRIAKVGVESCEIMGDVQNGYYLGSTSDTPKAAAPAPAIQGGSKIAAPPVVKPKPDHAA